MIMETEKTLILIKPDGVIRGLVGEVVRRFEQRGLKIVAMKMVRPNADTVGKHYTDSLEWLVSVGKKVPGVGTEVEKGKKIRSMLMDYLTSGPIVAMVAEGYHAVDVVRKLVGGTEPRSSAPGTIRGDFTADSYSLGDNLKRPVKNIVHASDTVDNAKHEIKVWFSENEIFNYSRADWSAIH